MRSSLLLILAAALVSAVCGDCDACIDGHCLRKQSLPRDSGGYEAINRNTNILIVSTRDAAHNHFITQCNLTTGTCKDTANEWDLWDFSIDQRTGDVYATGSWRKGIYKVDLVNNERVLLVDINNIRYMTFKDKLYYAPEHGGIFTFENGASQIVQGTEVYVVDSFIVDKKGDIYFEDINNGTPLFRKLRKGAVEATKFCDQLHRLSLDKDGNAMVISLNSYAVYRVADDELVEVGAVKDWVYGPLFDGDNNLVYGKDTHERYYLKRATGVYCTTERDRYKAVITETIGTTTPEPTERATVLTYATSAHESSSSPDDGGAGASNQQQSDQERHEDQTCTCNAPKLPSVTVKIEFH